MKIRYIYSACIEIETEDQIILTDPWFTEGIYDGSWFHFPKINEPLDIIREPDVIYISHIHPDHYDPIFLRKLFEKWGAKPIIIANFQKNYLSLKMKGDGFLPKIGSSFAFGKTSMNIIANETGSDSDIDSALIVRDSKNTVLNLNDCIYNQEHVSNILKALDCDKIDLLALGYTGAGPYPQTYYDHIKDKELLLEKANEKKLQFFQRYKKYIETFPSTYHLPFAGKYILGGKLTELNPFRGVSDPIEVKEFDSKSIILDDAGRGVIDLENGSITKQRNTKYSEQTLKERYKEVQDKDMVYEQIFRFQYNQINFKRLIMKAYSNGHSKSELKEDYWFVVHICDEKAQVRDSFSFNCNINKKVIDAGGSSMEPRSELYIDYRYLFGLLTGVFHWNNAEVGSQYNTRRFPTTAYSPLAQRFLNFLSL